jgi:chromosome segregation protein
VKSDLRYVNICDLLLGRTIIVDKLETARVLLPKVPAGWRVVTLEGEVIDRAGFVSGGSIVSKGTGLIGRSGRVQEMKESVKKLLLFQEKLESDERKVSADLKTFIAEGETLERKLHGEREEFESLERARSQSQSELERLSKDISLLDDEITTVRKDRDRLGIEIQELDSKLNAVMEDKEDCNRRMHSLQQYLEDGSGEREQILHRLTEIKIILASLDAKEESFETAFSLRRRTCSEYEEEMEKRRQEVGDAEERVKEFEKSIANIRNDLKGFSESREQFEKERLRVEEERKSMMCRIDENENSLRKRRALLREKEEEMHQVDVRYAQLDVEINSLTDRISSRHRVDLKTLAKERKAGEIDTQLMSEEAVRLQAKLEAMGPVNLVAIEEYKQLEERYDFLCGQRDDLLSAQESLKKAITRINRTTRSMFVETFRKVNEHFGRIFQSLFDGGKAELILVDEKDVLESGIEIIAQPPGKKLQSISLLSGGEKAMTAIALLFAIRGVKPSPFCVLDEIDAPLDDSNIGRFAQLVRESSQDSQFIIVTHNRTTIATSNIVHGVTMEERGISKQVSVRFSEKEGRPSAASKSEGVVKREPALR